MGGAFGKYAQQVDSVLDYWARYKKQNALDRFVRIEYVGIDKEYYTYSYDVKNVNFAFRLIPLQGQVDQVRFNYRYTAKINDVKYAEKHSCISTSPFRVPVTRYWEVGYTDEKRLKDLTSSEFRRDYDILFEVTGLRKDGVNYSLDDLAIPGSVEKVFETDSTVYPALYRLRKEEVVSELLCPEYQGLVEFLAARLKSCVQEKFPREVAWMDYAETRHRNS